MLAVAAVEGRRPAGPPARSAAIRAAAAAAADRDRPSDEEPQGDPMDDLESKEPPDGKWITAEDGREYFVTRLKKVARHLLPQWERT